MCAAPPNAAGRISPHPRSRHVSRSQNRHLSRAGSCESEGVYVGFEIGGFELGLDPDVSKVNVGNNAVAYWGVPDIEEAHARLLDRGAQARQPVTAVGDDIKVATVADPFGNVIGLIQNPHFRAKA
jgi:hypothetical protein